LASVLGLALALASAFASVSGLAALVLVSALAALVLVFEWESR
jgi:hypothetical protein